MAKKSPGKKLHKKPDRLVIAFDLGGTKLASAVVNLAGKPLAEHRELVDFGHGKAGFVKFLTLRAKAWQRQFPAVQALGIASCGPLDPGTGVLLQPTNFPKWGAISIKTPVERALKLPLFLQNDAAAAAEAEGWLGGAKKMKNWIVLTLGTGLGTGIVMNRKVFMGGSGQGPEAGHMIITDRPYLCGCGNMGCAEATISGSALKKRILERKLKYVDTRAIVLAAREGRRDAVEIFDEFSLMLGRLVHNLSVAYKPEAIFFTGGVAEAHDLFLAQTKDCSERLLAGRPGFMPKLAVSSLGHRLGILGGAYTAWHGLNSI
jgi:glucokinase